MPYRSSLKTLTLLHISLLTVLVLSTVFAYLQNGNFTAQIERSDILIYVVPILAAAGYFASLFFFQKLLTNIKREERLETKLRRYLTASLVKYALLGVPTLLATMAYYINGNALHLVIGISLTAYLFAQRPTVSKLVKDVPLSNEEQKQCET